MNESQFQYSCRGEALHPTYIRYDMCIFAQENSMCMEFDYHNYSRWTHGNRRRAYWCTDGTKA